MPDVALVATLREERGTRPSRRLRTEGRIPAVLYGHGGDPISISIDGKELRTALTSQTGGAVVLDLHLGTDTHLVIAREMQRHRVRHTVTHIDFQIVSRDEVVPADIPIHLVGEALNVSRNNGTVEHALLTLHVRAKAADIPPSIEVDITDLELGGTIRVSDLDIPASVTVDIDPETSVVIGQAPHAGAGEEGGAEEAEGADAASDEER
jgi:large subunit ribosomal protein L25